MSRKMPVVRYVRLMTELRKEAAKGDIILAPLVSTKPREILHGAHEDGKVYVDPCGAVVETLLHELLHRRYPGWSEKTVNDTAFRLIETMTPDQRRVWYRHFNRVAKRRTVPVEIE